MFSVLFFHYCDNKTVINGTTVTHSPTRIRTLSYECDDLDHIRSSGFSKDLTLRLVIRPKYVPLSNVFRLVNLYRDNLCFSIYEKDIVLARWMSGVVRHVVACTMWHLCLTRMDVEYKKPIRRCKMIVVQSRN